MLDRLSTSIASVTVGASAAASEEIGMGSYSMGVFFIPSDAGAVASITWYVAEKLGGTYLALTDEFASAVLQTVTAGNAYQLPSALAVAVAVKAVGDVAIAGALGGMPVVLKG